MCWINSTAKKKEKPQRKPGKFPLQTGTILNSLENIVVIVDRKSKIIMCNRAFETTFEMNAADILNKDIKSFFNLIELNDRVFPPEDLHGTPAGPLEASFTTPGGDRKELVVHFTPISGPDGEAEGGIVLASDITALKRDQQFMQQREKLALLGEMAAGVVHEIRNPLTAIKGFSHIIAARTQDEMIKNYAGIIESTANEVNKVVSDFLSFARPQSPVLREISVNKLIQSMKLPLENNLSMKGITLNISLAEAERNVMADEAQIRQVILNIINNSVDALNGSQNPRLTISTCLSETKDEMVITISDNGKGMTPEERIMAGTPFFTTKGRTGLGLSICYRIVNQHGGRISVDSEPGDGTAFVLSLPCKTAEARGTGPATDGGQFPGDILDGQ